MMNWEEFFNAPPLDPVIEFLEGELRIALESETPDVNLVLAIHRALRTLRATRAADEIRAQWGFTPETTIASTGGLPDRKTF